jgi:hypothetical protein
VDAEGATHEENYIVDGVPVYIPPPLPTLEEVKAECKRRVNTARDAEEIQPFAYLGKEFDADPVSVKRLTLAVQAAQSALLAGQAFEITWTCADNTDITLSETQMLGALEAMMRRGVELHEKARALKALIDAATTIEEAQAVNW